MMTLDEARECLGIARTADVEEIREAFRLRAREVHPDRHPDVDPSGRKRLELEFDRARTARDILVSHMSDPGRMPVPTRPSAAASGSPAAGATTRRAYRQTQSGGRGPSTRTPSPSPRTGTTARTDPPPRVTLRFDEFVEWTDALGFGTGKRAPQPTDWTRIGVWTVVGAAVLAVATEGLWVPLTF